MKQGAIKVSYIRSLSEFCASNAIDDAKRNAGLTTPDSIRRFDDIRYGEYERNVLDVYCPKDADGKVPIIVSIHGGGWVYGNKEIMQFYCMSLAEKRLCRSKLQLQTCSRIQASGTSRRRKPCLFLGVGKCRRLRF